jgi:Flp pilus assembly protein TadD
MAERSFQVLLAQGIKAIEQGNTMMALMHLEDASKKSDSPSLQSYLGFCLAKERRQYKKAISLCRNATKQEPLNSQYWLNLGRVCLLAGQKRLAIEAFRRGLKVNCNQQIVEEIKRLGLRKTPVFNNLDRMHFLNRNVGRMLDTLKLR